MLYWSSGNQEKFLLFPWNGNFTSSLSIKMDNVETWDTFPGKIAHLGQSSQSQGEVFKWYQGFRCKKITVLFGASSWDSTGSAAPGWDGNLAAQEPYRNHFWLHRNPTGIISGCSGIPAGIIFGCRNLTGLISGCRDPTGIISGRRIPCRNNFWLQRDPRGIISGCRDHFWLQECPRNHSWLPAGLCQGLSGWSQSLQGWFTPESPLGSAHPSFHLSACQAAGFGNTNPTKSLVEHWWSLKSQWNPQCKIHCRSQANIFWLCAVFWKFLKFLQGVLVFST